MLQFHWNHSIDQVISDWARLISCSDLQKPPESSPDQSGMTDQMHLRYVGHASKHRLEEFARQAHQPCRTPGASESAALTFHVHLQRHFGC